MIATSFLAFKLACAIWTLAVLDSLITPTATPAFRYSPSRILVKVLPPTLFGTVAFSPSFLLPLTNSLSLVLTVFSSSLPVDLASSINFLASSVSRSCLPIFLTSSPKPPSSDSLPSSFLVSVLPESVLLVSVFLVSVFSGSIMKGFSKGATSEPKTLEISPELVVELVALILIEPFSAVIFF